jgi:hypothetical protein
MKTPTAQIKLSSPADGHYRNFGRDIEADFAAGMPDHQIIAVTAPDPATRTEPVETTAAEQALRAPLTEVPGLRVEEMATRRAHAARPREWLQRNGKLDACSRTRARYRPFSCNEDEEVSARH